MRWNSAPIQQWHTWFAWYPVQVEGEKVWLERILRKGQKNYGNNKSTMTWHYVNSEFDLIKLTNDQVAEKQAAGMNVAVQHMSMPISARSKQFRSLINNNGMHDFSQDTK